MIARNKLSVSADLRKPEGQDLVRRLIQSADVLIENFRPGALERWNLDPAALLAANPRLIVLRVSGYGQTGPYAQRTGFGGIGEARYHDVAKALGCEGVHVTELEQLGPAIRKAFESGRPTCINVEIEVNAMPPELHQLMSRHE